MPDPLQATLDREELERLFSHDRLSSYLSAREQQFEAAIELYRWNVEVTAAFWEPIGHLEVALRNTLSDRLAARHLRLGRGGSWLDDPQLELSGRGRADIAIARARVIQKGKCTSDGQTISELSFGFWRFLVARKLTRLWPDLAAGFPHAPSRRRETVEDPLARLHGFRNRLAHHQRIWNHDLTACRKDIQLLAGFMNPGLPEWVLASGTLTRLLKDMPKSRSLPRAHSTGVSGSAIS